MSRSPEASAPTGGLDRLTIRGQDRCGDLSCSLRSGAAAAPFGSKVGQRWVPGGSKTTESEDMGQKEWGIGFFCWVYHVCRIQHWQEVLLLSCMVVDSL